MKVEIKIEGITDIQAAVKLDDLGLKTVLKFDTRIAPQVLARILNLQKQGCPITMLISSDQAAMDLEIVEYPTRKISAELVADKLTGEVMAKF